MYNVAHLQQSYMQTLIYSVAHHKLDKANEKNWKEIVHAVRNIIKVRSHFETNK